MISIPKNAFSLKKTVTREDLDALNHVNNIVYVAWIQEASEAHWMALTTEQIRQDCAWMVQRHEVDYLRQAFLDDELEIFTWPEPPQGKTSVRNVAIRNLKTGKLIMQSRSTWVFIDLKNGKPSPVHEVVARLFWD